MRGRCLCALLYADKAHASAAAARMRVEGKLRQHVQRGAGAPDRQGGAAARCRMDITGPQCCAEANIHMHNSYGTPAIDMSNSSDAR